jgi:hypothetical protein
MPSRAVTDAQTEAAHYAPCRGLGHTWRHHDPVANGGLVTWVSVCEYCGAERTKSMSRTGELVPNRYKYPAGYSLTGDARMSTVQWRRVLVRSALGS